MISKIKYKIRKYGYDAKSKMARNEEKHCARLNRVLLKQQKDGISVLLFCQDAI